MSKSKLRLTPFGIKDTIGRVIREKNNLESFLVTRFWLDQSNHGSIKGDGRTNIEIAIDTVLAPLNFPGAY